MTIKAHLNPGLAGGNRSESLDQHAARLYEHPTHVLALVELAPVDRVTPIDGGSEKDPLVRLRIERLEVAAAGETERVLRDVLRLLYLTRTAAGTLDADNEVRLAEATLNHAVDLVGAEQLAALTAILDWTLAQLAAIGADDKARVVDIRKTLAQVADRVAAARVGVTAKGGPAW